MALHRFDMRRVGFGLLLGLAVLSTMGCRQTGKWPYGYECLGPDGPVCFPCTRWGGYYPTCWDRWPDCSPKCPPPIGPGDVPLDQTHSPAPSPLPETFVPEPAGISPPQAPSPPVFKPVAPTPESSPSDNRPKSKPLDGSAVPEPKDEDAGASADPGILPSWASPDNWRRSGT